MRRLVVSAWLPYHRIAVLMIVPQRVVAPRSRSGRGIDADIVATRALYHFLTPVAEHIALETRSSLGSVVRKGTHKSFQSTLSWLGYLCIIEALLLQVAIPVDTEVHAQTIRISCYMVIGNGRYRRIMRTVTYCTRNVIIKITSQTATIIIGMASCASTQKFQMVGAFGKSTKLTTEEDSLFQAVVLSHSNLQLKPLKVSRQVVAGTNYRYECVDNNKKKVEVVVYKPLPGQGDARILSIGGKEYTE